MDRSSVRGFRQWSSCGLMLGLLAGARILSAAGFGLSVEKQSQPLGSQSSPPIPQSSLSLEQAPTNPGARSSISLAPAVAMVRCKLNQSYTQILILTNHTQQDVISEMVAEDVVVRDGKRSFVPAGEISHSIAATAVFSPTQVVVRPGQSVSVGVTFTLPPETALRAVVAMFRGQNKIPGGGLVAMTASLGTLFTFSVSDNFQIESSPVTVIAQSTTTNLGFSQVLTNTGSEPFVASGKAALLNQAGTLVGKVSFVEQRLLPGERLLFRTEYPAEVESGNYRVFASFQYEEKVITNSMDFTVP
jgi:hypothetical protein